MKILVVNCGSSSLKYQLMDMDNNQVLANGKCDRIGVKGINKPFIEYKRGNEDKIVKEIDLPDHTIAFGEVVKYLTDKKTGVIYDLSEIDAIGHRVVHGGNRFTDSTLVSDEVMKEFSNYIEYAPLHNPAHVQGINACLEVMPKVPQVMVFDTAFHKTIPDKAFMYAIPYEYYEKYAVRRYGFHGTSHKYITETAAKKIGKNKENINLISCHLGNGSSIAAVKNGRSIDTSMGFTPLEGLMMGTRSGDLDPAILEFIMKKENIDIKEMTNILNKKSGLYGISGVTGDIRDLKEMRDQGNNRAKLALEMFTYRVRKYIGSYMVALGHVDAIIFEGGIGEHNISLVRNCVEGLEDYGIILNNIETQDTNDTEEKELTTSDSRIKVLIIPTNEELKIAEETMEVIQK